MKVVSLHSADSLSRRTKSRWLQVAHGTAHALEQALGPGEWGDFLPGLGDVCVWGLAGTYEGRDVSGAIVTGFHPEPNAVIVMLSAFQVLDYLDFRPLSGLFDLPSACFDSLVFRSLVSQGPAIRILNRDVLVLETRSERAARIASALARHLVSDALITQEPGIVESREQLSVVADANGDVEDFAFGAAKSLNAQGNLINDWQ